MSGKRLPDFGLIAPIAPVLPASLAKLAAPRDFRTGLALLQVQSAQRGFLKPPFEPPRA